MQGDPAPLVFDAPLLLVGGGPADDALLAEAEALTTHLVAADGGADRVAALRGAARLEAMIGDMDSVGDAAAWAARLGARFLHVAEQDSTDLQKCLRLTRAPLTIGVGFMGGRIDHSLAALSALTGWPGRAIILLGEEDCAALLPPDWSCHVGRGTRVSLFPLAPCRIERCSGLEWPADGIDFRPAGPVGASNRASEDVVRLGGVGDGLLILLPRDRVDALARSLLPA